MSDKIYKIIGLMSGTSCDGIDAAYIETDGSKIYHLGEGVSFPYPEKFRKKLIKLAFEKHNADISLIEEVESKLTIFHAMAVKQLLDVADLSEDDIDMLGFHGHTVDHQPQNMKTWQIGNGQMLARLTKIPVMYDFRSADIMNGGQGAPLIPLYHRALANDCEKPVAIVNIGGVANITYIEENMLTAFDTGPGNALIDDYIYLKYGLTYDENGGIASRGKINNKLLDALCDNLYFRQKPPKSLDRNQFSNFLNKLLSYDEFKDLRSEDVTATLTEFTAKSIYMAQDHLKQKPVNWYFCGGGIHNKFLMHRLKTNILKLNTVGCVDAVSALRSDLNSDFLEAQGFGFLAARSKNGLPISLPSTTGIKTISATGGVFCPA